jgi:hypothetical protein
MNESPADDRPVDPGNALRQPWMEVA